jgi:hypothetical protein
MAYTLGEAARATGKSKPTLARAIKNGMISAARRENGSYEIDPAELHRVYPPVTPDAGSPTGTMQQTETANVTGPLQREVALLREMVDDLRRRLDASEEERRQLSLRLLPDQRPWWRRWRGC